MFRHTDRKADDSTQASHASELLCRLWFLFAEFQGHRIETSCSIPHFTQSNSSQFSLMIFEGSLMIIFSIRIIVSSVWISWTVGNRDAPFGGSSFTILKLWSYFCLDVGSKLFQVSLSHTIHGTNVYSTVYIRLISMSFPGWVGSSQDLWVGTKRNEICGWLGALEITRSFGWLGDQKSHEMIDGIEQKYDDSFMIILLYYCMIIYVMTISLCYDYIMKSSYKT